MPSISNQDVHKFWSEHYDPVVYKTLAFMESIENWTLDGDSELENSLAKLGSELDNIGYVDLQKEDKIIQIAAYIKMGRVLRLLQCIDAAHPGAASKILMFAKSTSKEADDVPGLFIRRNIVFERLRLLGRVFSPDRLTEIMKVMGEGTHV